MNIPLQEAGEIIEHIGRKRKCKAVDVRLVLTCCQDSYDRNESFKDDRDDEHRATERRDEARAFHKIPYPSAMHSRIRSGPIFSAAQAGFLAALRIASILSKPILGEVECSKRSRHSRWARCCAGARLRTVWNTNPAGPISDSICRPSGT